MDLIPFPPPPPSPLFPLGKRRETNAGERDSEMHRNPANSFFREVATVLHDTEMEIRVEGNWLMHDEKLYRFYFFFFVERKDTMKRIYDYLPSPCDSNLDWLIY